MSRVLVFLDIDGVLYPCLHRKVFLRNTNKLRSQLKEKGYRSAGITDHDLCAFAYGFHQDAITYLKKLVVETKAELVISSSWKFSHSLEVLKALFSLHNLDDYISDMTANSVGFIKEPAIKEYLETCPDISKYVVLDDIDMRDTFHEHAICCPDVFDRNCYEQALQILKNR